MFLYCYVMFFNKICFLILHHFVFISFIKPLYQTRLSDQFIRSVYQNSLSDQFISHFIRTVYQASLSDHFSIPVYQASVLYQFIKPVYQNITLCFYHFYFKYRFNENQTIISVKGYFFAVMSVYAFKERIYIQLFVGTFSP